MLGHGATAVPHGPKEVAWVFVPPSRLRHAEPAAPPLSPTPGPSVCAATSPDTVDTVDTAGTKPAAPTPAAAATPAAPPGGGRAYLEAVLQQKPPLPKPRRTTPLTVRPGLDSPQRTSVAPAPTDSPTTAELQAAVAEAHAANPAVGSKALVLSLRRERGWEVDNKTVKATIEVVRAPGFLCPSSGAEALPPQERPLSSMRVSTMERHCALLEPLAKRPRRDPRPRSQLMQRQRASMLEKRAMQNENTVPAAAC